jgi:hypothetical protein
MSKEALLSAYIPERMKTVYRETRNGVTTIETRQDAEPIIEWVKKNRDLGRDEIFTHIAEVPIAVMNQAMAEGWFHDQAAWKKWANNPDNRDFRVWEGKW